MRIIWKTHVKPWLIANVHFTQWTFIENRWYPDNKKTEHSNNNSWKLRSAHSVSGMSTHFCILAYLILMPTHETWSTSAHVPPSDIGTQPSHPSWPYYLQPRASAALCLTMEPAKTAGRQNRVVELRVTPGQPGFGGHMPNHHSVLLY